jgi:two-component system OmpR family response regulator
VAARIVVDPSLPGAVAEALATAGFDVIEGGAADLAVIALDDLPNLRGMRTVVVADKDDIVAALTAGADDAVPPTVDPDELTARVHAILRRVPAHAEVLRFADVVLDAARNEVHRGAVELDLTATEFRLLRFLLEHPRRALSRAQILDGVWPAEPRRRSNLVETYVRYLRRKLEAAGPPLIRTVRQVGYMLDDRDAS